MREQMVETDGNIEGVMVGLQIVTDVGNRRCNRRFEQVGTQMVGEQIRQWLAIS